MLIISSIILNSLKYWYARDDKFYSAEDPYTGDWAHFRNADPFRRPAPLISVQELC